MSSATPTQPPRTPTSEISVGRLATTVFTVIALLFSIVAMGIAAADDDDGSGGAVQAGAVDGDAVPVALSEFAFSPDPVEVEEGGSLAVSNKGAADHILAVEGQDLTTPTLTAGKSATLALGDLAAGHYTLVCTVPGHKEAGMTGDLNVVKAGEAASGAGTGDHANMTAVQMDTIMAARTKLFPAKTEGTGGQALAPTVLADGTKEFQIVSSEIDWEVEPGKTVKAMAYNGMVPGPTLRLNIGDKFRLVLKNEMTQSTAIHFHGLRTPNAMDGVPDITQPPVKPGETFVYEFVAKGPAVGMYHSHHNAQVQVPNGLAGTILVGDLPLPAGVNISQEIPMMLNDAGTIGFSLNGKSFPATAPVAVKPGEWALVHYLNEGVMAHPMHLHGLEQIVIAKDGLPVPEPYKVDTVNVSPGERYSVLVHADEPGVWAWHCHILPHAEREDGMFGMVTAMIVK